MTCTSTIAHADGTTENAKTTVVTKSAKKVVTRTSGQGRSTAFLLPGGRLRTTTTIAGRDSGIRIRITTLGNYPAPAKLLHHRSGSATVTMEMTLPKRLAKAMLTSGRTLTLTGTYRIAGLGSRSITLADPAATVVDAVGTRTTLRSLKVTNAKPAVARKLKRLERPVFASLGSTTWIAQHRGTVRSESTDADGSALTATQVSCD